MLGPFFADAVGESFHRTIADVFSYVERHVTGRPLPAGFDQIVLGVLFFAVLTGAYTIYGGLKSAAWTDFMQIVVLGAGGVLVPILGLIKVGGFAPLVHDHPEKFQVFLPPTHE